MSNLNALTCRSWNPFSEMDELNNHLNHLLFGSSAVGRRGRAVEAHDWVPLVDVVERDGEYVIKAELPEIDKKDISVTVEDGILTLSGERKAEAVSEDAKVHRTERYYGKFVRTFKVPENADATKVAAEFKSGVLRVTLPKVEEAKPKSIEVAVA